MEGVSVFFVLIVCIRCGLLIGDVDLVFDIKLYYVFGCFYFVGDVERFMYVISNVIGVREEVRLVYILVGEFVL